MSDQPLKSTQGPYYVMPNSGGFDILDANNEVVAMAHDLNVAVLMASSSELLDACIETQEKVEEIRDVTALFYKPSQARVLHDKLNDILASLSQAFEKLHAEADV